ncbi:MAG TPA: hypothetical protein VH438_11160 [Gemmatimonadales bacterium]
MADTLPSPLRWTQILLVVLALLQLVVCLMFVSHRPEVVASWARRQPNLTSDQVEHAANQTIVGSVIFHAAVAILFAGLALMLPRGRRWIRLVTTAALGIGGIAGYGFLRDSSALIPAEVAGATIEQLASMALRIAALWLLWIPRAVRDFFATTAGAG